MTLLPLKIAKKTTLVGTDRCVPAFLLRATRSLASQLICAIGDSVSVIQRVMDSIGVLPMCFASSIHASRFDGPKTLICFQTSLI